MNDVPRGLYRNRTGGEMHVMRAAYSQTLPAGLRTISGDIFIAESYDELFGTTDTYLVTEASLKECGYELVTPA